MVNKRENFTASGPLFGHDYYENYSQNRREMYAKPSRTEKIDIPENKRVDNESEDGQKL